MSKTLRGKTGFIEYYTTILQQYFPEQNFAALQAALEYQSTPITHHNPNNPAQVYHLNAASLLPVQALNPQHGDIVLDACAAPGGKALYIAEAIGKTGKLIANDISPARRFRMKQLFLDWDYAVETRHGVSLLGKPAETLFKIYPNYFDKILVDAPCSSEKHVWNSPKHLAQWSYSRIKQLKQRQIALLSGLFLALKPGGTMVYSTCAITPEENEQVVEKLLKKRGDVLQLIEQIRVWPQPDKNLDPMFVAKFIHKLPLSPTLSPAAAGERE
ncbi:MAG: RsmB/NOP family class I SAM-dependent RNA methyltransferase [Patescibacteria group bacterium]|jgi:16S rRNA C967 or C1407 C5-methylase (RsmB/RsmF family)